MASPSSNTTSASSSSSTTSTPSAARAPAASTALGGAPGANASAAAHALGVPPPSANAPGDVAPAAVDSASAINVPTDSSASFSSSATSTPSASRVLPTTAAAPAARAVPSVAPPAVAASELNVATASTTALGVSRSIVPPHTNFAPAHWMGGGGRALNYAGAWYVPMSAASGWESAPGPRSTFAPVMWSQPFASSTTVASTTPASDIAHAQEQGASTSPAPDVTNIAHTAQERGASSSSAPRIVHSSLNPDAPAFIPSCRVCGLRPALIGIDPCGHLALCDWCYRRRCICPCCDVPVLIWVRRY